MAVPLVMLRVKWNFAIISASKSNPPPEPYRAPLKNSRGKVAIARPTKLHNAACAAPY
jgi:hypothetical protein